MVGQVETFDRSCLVKNFKTRFYQNFDFEFGPHQVFQISPKFFWHLSNMFGRFCISWNLKIFKNGENGKIWKCSKVTSPRQKVLRFRKVLYESFPFGQGLSSGCMVGQIEILSLYSPEKKLRPSFFLF